MTTTTTSAYPAGYGQDGDIGGGDTHMHIQKR